MKGYFFKLIRKSGSLIKAIKLYILGEQFIKKHCDVILNKKTFKNEKEYDKYLIKIIDEFINNIDKIDNA